MFIPILLFYTIFYANFAFSSLDSNAFCVARATTIGIGVAFYKYGLFTSPTSFKN